MTLPTMIIIKGGMEQPTCVHYIFSHSSKSSLCYDKSIDLAYNVFHKNTSLSELSFYLRNLDFLGLLQHKSETNLIFKLLPLRLALSHMGQIVTNYKPTTLHNLTHSSTFTTILTLVFGGTYK